MDKKWRVVFVLAVLVIIQIALFAAYQSLTTGICLVFTICFFTYTLLNANSN